HYVKDLLQYPKYAIEIEPIDDTFASSSVKNQVQNTKSLSQNTSDAMNISSEISSNQINIRYMFDADFILIKKHANESTITDKSFKFHILKDLIKELFTKHRTSQTSVVKKENANNFVNLYNNITTAEAQNEITNQEVIICYYHFGKALDNKYDYYKKSNP
ncbi:18475_t:CDS:2, partial [Racocetra fulgida]